MRGSRRWFVTAAVTAVALLAPATASASFHLIKISEVSVDSDGTGGYIELQSFAPGQTLLAGQTVTTYRANGTVAARSTLSENAANGESQRTYLLGASGFVGFADETGVAAATAIENLTAGGAVCWDAGAPPDCVSWGGFHAPASLPAPGAGPPAPALPATGMSLTRDIGAHCSSALDAADDRDSSAADFSLRPLSPRANSQPAPTKLCPDTKIVDGPKQRTTNRIARFTFKSVPRGATFECKLDDGRFESCEKESSFAVARGEHRLRVRAVNDRGGTDQSPATYRWKRVRPS